MKQIFLNKRRFTLVEMLAALVIMIIIASLVVPAVAKMMTSQGAEGGAAMLQAKLRAVRAYAVKNNKTAGLFIFTTGTDTQRTSFRPVEWNPTATPPAWTFIADNKIDYLPAGGAVDVPVVYSDTYIDSKTKNAAGYDTKLLKSGSLADPYVDLVVPAKNLPALGLTLDPYTIDVSSSTQGWIIGFKSNGQPVVVKNATGVPTYAAAAVRVSAVKQDSAGVIKPKTDKLKPDGTPIDGGDGYEDVDFSTLVIDRYTGQTRIIANK